MLYEQHNQYKHKYQDQDQQALWDLPRQRRHSTSTLTVASKSVLRVLLISIIISLFARTNGVSAFLPQSSNSALFHYQSGSVIPKNDALGWIISGGVTKGSISRRYPDQPKWKHHRIFSPSFLQEKTSNDRNEDENEDEDNNNNRKNDDDGDDDHNKERNLDIDSVRQELQSLFDRDDEKTAKNQQKQNTQGRKDTSLSVSSSSSSSSSSSFDLRAFLNHTSSILTENYKNKTSALLPPPPPLSTIERDNRMAEIQALQRLQEETNANFVEGQDKANNISGGSGGGEEVIAQLWTLWYSQRGGEALARLRQADQLMADPTSWQDCETSLLQLIEKEYSIYFVEAVNRLATLYFLQGRLEESYQLCRLILIHLKPWHIGAASGMVQICIMQGRQREEARYWATQRLPSVVAGSSFPGAPLQDEDAPTNPRRLEWIEGMVKTAKEMLQDLEQRTQANFFGDPESYYKPTSSSTSDINTNTTASTKNIEESDVDDDNAWQ